MKFLLFTTEYPPFYGGVANYYGNVVKFWPGNQSNPISVLDNQGGRLMHPLWRWLPSFLQLYKKCKHDDIDHVLVGQILPLGTVALIVTAILKKRYSVFLHGMDLSYAFRSKRKSILAKLILKNAHQVICGNRYVSEILASKAGVDVSKIVIANPGVEPLHSTARHEEEIRRKYNIDDRLIVFSLGRLVRRKGFDRLIETIPSVAKEEEKVLYVIGGAGPDDSYLREKADALGDDARSRIIFLGKISDDEYHAWLSLCDVFVMPSRNIDGDFEGFGIVYLEANSFGKPVVAGDSGGVRDAVIDGVNGLLVNPDNKDDIANALISLLKDKNLRDKLGQAGKMRAINDFNWPKKVANIYNSLK